MKKIILSLFSIAILSLFILPVLAKESTTPGSNRSENAKDKVENMLERKSEKEGSKAGEIEDQKKQNINRIRNSINARWNAYDKLSSRSGQLLDKLQIRIDKAKAAGQNTSDADAAMTDARAKLADARAKLNVLKGLVGTAMDKNSFKDAQKKFQAVHKDLNIVRQDAAKIIKTLRSFNSEKLSTKSGELHSSSSAKDRD